MKLFFFLYPKETQGSLRKDRNEENVVSQKSSEVCVSGGVSDNCTRQCSQVKLGETAQYRGSCKDH